MAASEIMELVVEVSPEGTEETAAALETVEETFEETADGAEEKAGVLDRFARRWKGAMTVIVGALATASAALLSQVPIVSDLMDGLMAIVEAVALQMDQFLRPALQGVTDDLFGWAEAIGDAEGPLGEFIGLIGTLIAVAAPFATGIGILAWTGKLGAAIALLTGPVGWLILAAGLIATAWVTNFGNIRGVTEGVITDIASVFEAHLPAWLELWERVTGAIAGFWANWGDEIQRVAEFVFDLLGTLFVQNLDFLLSVATAFLQLLTGDWKGAWATMTGYFDRTLARWSSFFGRWKESFTNLWRSMVTGVQAIVRGFVTFILGIFTSMATGVLTRLRTFLSQIRAWGSSLRTAFGDAAKAAASALLGPIERALSRAIAMANRIRSLGRSAASAPGRAVSRARNFAGLASGGRIVNGGLVNVHAGEEVVPAAQVERNPNPTNRFAERDSLTVRFEPRRFEEFVSAELEGPPANTGRGSGPQG